MAESAQIQRISYSHEALINWLLENPDRPLRDAAAYFGYTQSWVSTVIHSDIFQAKLLLRQDAVFGCIAQDIPSRLRAAANIGLDRVTNILETSNDSKLLIDATDKILHRMGYAPAAKAPTVDAQVVNNTQINNFTISASDLTEARELMQTRNSPTVEGELLELPAPRV